MRDYNNGVTPRARSYPKFCEVSPPKNARRHPKKCVTSSQHLRGVTPKMEGWPLHQIFQNYYFPEANQLRVLTVHEGHMGHYHHWRTDDSSSSCFCAIVNVGKMRGVTPTDANQRLKRCLGVMFLTIISTRTPNSKILYINH